MEAKHLASVFSFLSIFLAIYAQSLDSKKIDHNNDNNNYNNNNNEEDDDSTEFELEEAIYYGDANVNIGEPFSITCIIPITDPITWMKDNEQIIRHNLRHGRDEHAYVTSETPFEGDKHKIEAHLSVRHALKVHEGKYQCNFLHTSFHMLQVWPAVFVVTPQTISPFIITANPKFSSGGGHSPASSSTTTTTSSTTATGNTASKDNRWHNSINSDYDNARTQQFDRYDERPFGHSGHKQRPQTPAVTPTIGDITTGSATTNTVGGQMTGSVTTEKGQVHHNRQHHNYQQPQRPQRPQLTPRKDARPFEDEVERRIIYINATHFDGIPRAASTIISESNIGSDGRRADHRIPADRSASSDELVSPINWEHFPDPSTAPTAIATSMENNPDSEYTTLSEWRLQQQKQQPNHHYTMLPPQRNSDGSSWRQQRLEMFQPETTSPAAAAPMVLYNTPIYEPDTTSTSTASQNIGGRTITHHHHHQQPLQLEYDTTSVIYGTTQGPYPPHGQMPPAVPHHHQSKNLPLSRPQSVGQQPSVGGRAATTPFGIGTTATTTTTTTQLSPAIATIGSGPENHSQPGNSGAATMILAHKEPDFLVPNYDNVEHQMKFFDIRTPLVLSCNITQEGKFELSWEKNGTDVSKVKELQGRHRIITAENKFIIDRTERGDDGTYACVANNQRKDIIAVAHVAVRVPSNTGVVEGEKLTIVCTVAGTDPQLSWTIGNLTIYNSTDRYILSPNEGVANAIINMENASLDDRGDFTCTGRNAATEYGGEAPASDVSLVRVKGKLAALWPFLGICAEVLILCTIILIYEKRRNKSELEESDTDGQEQKKKRRNYD